ncbi:hypothetical protein, partial [Thermogemmatispora onikobensis]|uniref:hypothetical protein n=1 Tax=Thermogemmatispora onikobensis TaxID=732234 RepID=UPI00114C8D60
MAEDPKTKAVGGETQTRDLVALAVRALQRWSLGPGPSPESEGALEEPSVPAAPDPAQSTVISAQGEEQGRALPLPSTLEAVGENDPIARYRKQIEEFDADREAPIGKGIRLLLLTTGYVAPVCCAALLGWEFGELFGKGVLFFSAALHVLSLSAELIIAGLALATAWSLKRLGSDRHMLPRAVLCGALFLVASIGSATALWWALSSSPIPPIVLAFRVIVPVIIEVGGMAIVATLDFQSLEAFLAALHRRAEAIQRLSEAELRLKAAE